MPNTKKLRVSKKGEFDLGVMLNFLGFVAITIAAILYLFDSISYFGITVDNSLITKLIQDFSEICLVGGFALVCIGVYLKKQEGMAKKGFVISLLSIIISAACYVLFIIILSNAFDAKWLQETCIFLGQVMPIGLILCSCAWIVKGIIQSHDSFHASRYAKINFFSFIFAVVCLLISIFYYAIDVAGFELSGDLGNYLPYVYEISFILTLFLMSVSILRVTRGFQHHATKVLTLVALILGLFAIIAATLYAVYDLFAIGSSQDTMTKIVEDVYYFEAPALATSMAIFAFFSLNVFHFAPVRA